jgi:hypothetical protein
MAVKRIIINIVIVIVVVLVFDYLIGRTLRHYYFKETSGFHYRTTYSMEKTDADILIFGSSRANHHYIPEVFEDSLKMTFYNTGRDGNGILFQTAVLQSALKRYKPKLIIIDYYGEFIKNDEAFEGLQSLLPYYRTHEEIRKYVTQKSPFERIKLLSEIYPFNSQILSIAIGNLEMNKQRYDDKKGYVPLYTIWPSPIETISKYEEYPVDTVKVVALRSFLELARNAKARVLVIYSPIFQKFEKKQEIEICRGICSAENVPFWDYSKDTLFLNHNNLFRDVQHLNDNGAKIFSNLIVSRIKNEFFKTPVEITRK